MRAFDSDSSTHSPNKILSKHGKESNPFRSNSLFPWSSSANDENGICATGQSSKAKTSKPNFSANIYVSHLLSFHSSWMPCNWIGTFYALYVINWPSLYRIFRWNSLLHTNWRFHWAIDCFVSISAGPFESFQSRIGFDTTCCTLELFRSTKRFYIWATIVVHYVRPWPIVCQSSHPFPFHLKYSGEVLQRQCHISLHTQSADATIYCLRRTLHHDYGHYEFFPLLENWQTAVAGRLCFRIGSYINARRSKTRNWLQSYDTGIDLGRIHGKQQLSFGRNHFIYWLIHRNFLVTPFHW